MRFVLPMVGVLAACGFDAPTGVPLDAPAVDVPTDVDTGNRVTAGLVGLWRFDEGTGSTVGDTTRAIHPAYAKEPMQLEIAPLANTEWVSGGVKLLDRAAITSPTNPQAHICRDVIASGAMTIELWVTPADAQQGLTDYAVLFTLSPNATYRNASIAQSGDQYIARVLTSETSTTLGRAPEIVSPAGTASNAVTHVVLVADAAQRTLYINGEPSVSSPSGAGSFAAWKDNYRITIGDEQGSDHHWEGTLWFAAAYERALTQAEILENFAAGFDCTSC